MSDQNTAEDLSSILSRLFLASSSSRTGLDFADFISRNNRHWGHQISTYHLRPQYSQIHQHLLPYNKGISTRLFFSPLARCYSAEISRNYAHLPICSCVLFFFLFDDDSKTDPSQEEQMSWFHHQCNSNRSPRTTRALTALIAWALEEVESNWIDVRFQWLLNCVRNCRCFEAHLKIMSQNWQNWKIWYTFLYIRINEW